MEAFEIIRITMTEFADVEDSTVKAFLSLAEPLISRKKYGKLYPQALACLAAIVNDESITTYEDNPTFG